MKKSIALVALAFGVTSAFAQDLTSKKGEPILPEAKDWSIGIDATPFLQYAGNFFGKTANNTAPTWNFPSSVYTQITGKMFKDAQTAYRASIRLGIVNANTVRNNVSDRTTPSTVVYPGPLPTKENSWVNSSTNVGLSVGYEKRRGKTRLQGFYGAEVGISISSSSDKFKYGNALNPVSTTTAAPIVNPNGNGSEDAFSGYAGGGNVTTGAGIPGVTLGGARLLSNTSGLTFAFGVRAFIGAEYFFMPKMSFAGEFGWGVAFSSTAASTQIWESNGNTGTGADITAQTTIKGAPSSRFILDNNNNNSMWGPSGSLKLNFHF